MNKYFALAMMAAAGAPWAAAAQTAEKATAATLQPAAALVEIPPFDPAPPSPAAMIAAAVASDAPAPAMSVAAAPDDGAPALPAGFTESFAPPPRDSAGAYQTLNRGLGAAEAMWHVRAALNVAALGCRGEGEAQAVAAYNAMLSNEKALLAAADVASQAADRGRFGDGWQAHHDDAMTRLYNFFAQPPAHAAFCEAAGLVLREAAAVAPADFAAFATAALPRLEAPFLAAFARFDEYRASLSEWRARRSAPVIATAVALRLGPGEP